MKAEIFGIFFGVGRNFMRAAVYILHVGAPAQVVYRGLQE
jgi:hypothetical protein